MPYKYYLHWGLNLFSLGLGSNSRANPRAGGLGLRCAESRLDGISSQDSLVALAKLDPLKTQLTKNELSQLIQTDSKKHSPTRENKTGI